MQDPNCEVIAEKLFEAVFSGTTERVPIRVWIGKPFIAEEGHGACPCGLEGLDGTYPRIGGVDPFHALGIAMAFVFTRLRDEIVDGKLILYNAGESEPITVEDLSSCFGFPRSLGRQE